MHKLIFYFVDKLLCIMAKKNMPKKMFPKGWNIIEES